MGVVAVEYLRKERAGQLGAILLLSFAASSLHVVV